MKDGWKKFFESNYIDITIERILDKCYKRSELTLPPVDKVLRLFDLIDIDEVKVVIIGQDPYHTKGYADGVAFSSGNAYTPPSLREIFGELFSDCFIDHTSNPSLDGWVKQGVLLINSCWTVLEGKPGSDVDFGWDEVVINILDEVNRVNKDVIYCIWGKHAANLYKKNWIKSDYVIATSHPSPLSSYKGFKGSKTFSRVNEMLTKLGKTPINWIL